MRTTSGKMLKVMLSSSRNAQKLHVRARHDSSRALCVQMSQWRPMKNYDCNQPLQRCPLSGCNVNVAELPGRSIPDADADVVADASDTVLC